MGAVGEHQSRPLLLIDRTRDPLSRSETCLPQGLVPDDRLVLEHQHVGVAVAVQVDEPDVGVRGGRG